MTCTCTTFGHCYLCRPQFSDPGFVSTVPAKGIDNRRALATRPEPLQSVGADQGREFSPVGVSNAGGPTANPFRPGEPS